MARNVLWKWLEVTTIVILSENAKCESLFYVWKVNIGDCGGWTLEKTKPVILRKEPPQELKEKVARIFSHLSQPGLKVGAADLFSSLSIQCSPAVFQPTSVRSACMTIESSFL